MTVLGILLRIAFAFGLTATLTAGVPAQVAAVDVDARLEPGPGRFAFPFFSAGRTREITVYYHRPAAAGPDAPILFVLHGEGRNAEAYRRHWMGIAEEKGYLLLVPEFSKEEFPGSRAYNLGFVHNTDGTPNPESQWSYTAIEDIFAAVRSANRLAARSYFLYGHSAGAQFVHRLVMLKPAARFRVAIAANAGWYLMPDFDVRYPYGLSGAGIDPDRLALAFGRRLIVLLGDRDIDPEHPSLHRTSEAMRQGIHRYERGQRFYETARRKAAEIGAPFAWSLKIAPGVTHSDARMVPHAARLLAGE
jgi:predicted esterase